VAEGPGAGVLEAEHVLEFPYTRSTGRVLGAFFAGLEVGRVLGARACDGRIIVPPQEYDPVTAHDLTDLVDVGTSGEVVTWSWNPTPKHGQPLDRPFAWALVKLDGADTPMLHALDVDGPDAVSTGMRVRIRWADEREGRIQDIACFEPDDGPADTTVEPGEVGNPIEVVTTPIRIEMDYRPGIALEPFLLATQQKKLLGRRCTKCDKVYLMPRGVCSMCGAAFTDEQVELGPNGTVATFLVVNVPFASQEIEIPYTAAEVLFDGAHTTAQFLLLGVGVDEVRMGMRVRAVWKDGDDLEPTLSNITHVEPIDELDVPYEDFADYV